MGEAEQTRWASRAADRLTSAITRRAALRSFGASSLALLAGPRPRARAAAEIPGTPAAESRPNIILILLDDMRADDMAMMAQVQSLLVAPGASFANFFVTSPGCAPARASILRGQYPHNHRVLRGSGDLGGLDDFQANNREASTIATWLRDAGYRTALVGKYLNGYGLTPEYIPPGWDEWYGATNEGYSRFEINQNGKLVRYRSGKEPQNSTDVFGALAEDFVTRTSQSGQPFFLYLAPRAPHGPAEPAVRHADALPGATAPRPPSFNEADVSDKPTWVQVLPSLGEADIAQVDEYFRARLQTLLAVDEMVAGLVAALDAAGTLDNTYIVFTSDNGYDLGEHRIVREKGSPYEEAIHMPLVVRGPGVPAGETIAAIGSQVDLGPTFAAWADAAVPDFVDGRSLVPLLGGGPAPEPWRQTALIEQFANRPDRSTEQPAFEAVRGDDFVYVEYATGERELYALADDPYEEQNLAATAAPDLLQALSERVSALQDCAADTCRTVEEAPLPDMSALAAASA